MFCVFCLNNNSVSSSSLVESCTFETENESICFPLLSIMWIARPLCYTWRKFLRIIEADQARRISCHTLSYHIVFTVSQQQNWRNYWDDQARSISAKILPQYFCFWFWRCLEQIRFYYLRDYRKQSWSIHLLDNNRYEIERFYDIMILGVFRVKFRNPHTRKSGTSQTLIFLSEKIKLI
jgi:hypothetical protein